MALDRQSIEKKDFAIRRRGYDPGEVDAHLAAIATEVEELKRAAPPSRDTFAAAASEHVRAIVEAAETSPPRRARRRDRDQAPGRARAEPNGGNGAEGQSTAALIGRLEAMQNELTALLEALGAGGATLHAGLQTLEEKLEGVRDAVPRPAPASEGAVVLGDAVREPLVAEDSSEKVHGDALAGGTDDARLIALNMALNGSSREETEHYLAQNFKLRDQHALVDEVYASVEG